MTNSGNHFDVFAPGYLDSFVTNVMVTAKDNWTLVEPTALPLRMKGGDIATYKVVRPPECSDGGTIAFHNYYIASDRDGGLKDIVVEAGANVTYTAHKNGSLCASDWTVNGEAETDTSRIVFNRRWWDVPSWFIPSMDTPKPGVYNINAHDVQHTALKDSGSMTVVGVKRISGPNGKASERADAPTGGETWLETEVIYAHPRAVFNLTAELEPGLPTAEIDKIKDSIEWSAESARITPDESNPLLAECCAPDDEGTYEVEVSCGESRRVILVKVGVLKIHQVWFSDNIPIMKDGTNVFYSGAAWKDDDLDGVSDLTGANADASKPYQPVAYLSTKSLLAVGKFLPSCSKVSNPGEYISSFDAEAAVQKLRFAPNNRLFGWDWSAPVAFNKNGTQVTAASPFRSSAEVGYESEYELAWEVGFGEQGTADDGLSWHRSRSQHELYLTYKAELSSYETVFHLSCTSANGKNTDSEVAAGVWSGFESRNVKRKDGVALSYYKSYKIRVTQMDELLKVTDGQCGAWANLLVNTLLIQGILSVRIICMPSDKDCSGFMVRTWSFLNGGTSGWKKFPYKNLVKAGSADFWQKIRLDTQYDWDVGSEVSYTSGTPGQNNSNPAALFTNHQVVYVYDLKAWCDPSYGLQHRSLQSFDNALSGFWTLRAGDVFMQKNPIGVQVAFE